VYPLYGSIQPSVWDTLCFEANSDNALRSLMAESGQEMKENISYPSILEKIYFK
jgi:hypothetical protein